MWINKKIVIFIIITSLHLLIFITSMHLFEVSSTVGLEFGFPAFYHGLITHMNVPLRWIASDFLRENPQYYWVLLTLNSAIWGIVGLVILIGCDKLFSTFSLITLSQTKCTNPNNYKDPNNKKEGNDKTSR